ncbi:MAG: BMP family ABC transporter substrate-binding protein [Angelakisella sp.]|jgi:basic membrane protein A|nr:BMP family ABC transporter substrate-binding protein [Angelakisella sp.]MCI9528962.1 BMP family ABC transporter substrate-binding protein [Angelakisella sp.]
MKKYLSIFLAALMVATMMAGCGGGNGGSSAPAPSTPAGDGGSTPAPAPEGTKVWKVANIVNGNLGDKSFFDSCEAGLKKLQDDGLITYKTFELGATDADQPKWVSTLDELSADAEYDLIVCGTYQMDAYLNECAQKYPDQKYFIYDAEVAQPNVASITFKQNDLGYLVGTAAALMTSSDMEKINPEKVIGFVGGEDGPVINDFLVGYIQGAQAADPEVKIDTQYVGNFFDTGRGKEIANVMINNKCDVIWGVAGGAGNGAAEAAAEKDVWFIGVDSDQEATFSASQPQMAAVTIFSGLKNCGDGIIYMLNELNAGTIQWGKTTQLGIVEGGVGLTNGGNFQKLPDNIKKALEDVVPKVSSGEIKVDTAFDESFDIKGLRDSVRP